MAGRRRGGAVVRAAVDTGTAELVADPDRPDAYTLLLDAAPQSHVDLADPTRLEFEYVRWLGDLLDLVAEPGAPIGVLHLGGGGLTLPRYVAATRPRSAQRVVERDGALVELVRRELPLARECRPRIRIGDAREAVETMRAGSFDVVIADVFAGTAIPVGLTTVEFLTAVARVLRPGGCYLQNVADGAGCAFTRGQVATQRAVFAETLLVSDASVLRGRRFGNLVLAAADGPLPVAELTRRGAGAAFPARVMAGEQLDRFVGRTRPVTDATATDSPAPPAAPFARR
ncbi:spermidine synthase [Actinocatenispora sera]|uniref:spermidine synthase n=1 Tax=Actinocatenispora sera TaxID=390989 RepID=UPI0004C367C3|nr:fused MFS/spermidine synthase [Actinocatenispora sera]